MATTTSGQETEKINTNIVTLTRFLTEEQTKHAEATGDFTYVKPKLLPLLHSCLRRDAPNHTPSSSRGSSRKQPD